MFLIQYFKEKTPKMSYTYDQLRSLSIIELKEILHKKQIDSVGIFDSATLIDLILGKQDNQDYKPKLPQSYLQLFEVFAYFLDKRLGRK